MDYLSYPYRRDYYDYHDRHCHRHRHHCHHHYDSCNGYYNPNFCEVALLIALSNRQNQNTIYLRR